MAKKIIPLVLIIIVFAACTVFCFLGFSGEPESGPRALTAKSYVDYAKDVRFDTEKYPELADQGIFWVKWDEATNELTEIAADTAEGAALIDPNKPTVIFGHGMMSDGHYAREGYSLNGNVADPDEFDMDTEDVSFRHLWIREGWNVGMYHYEKFVAESINFSGIEGKIWSTTTDLGVRFRYENNSVSEKDVSEYALAEHMAADYVRAMKLLPDTMGSKEIRIAAHSMGGQLSTATIFLLTELARTKQIEQRYLPDRFAMLDPFFGMYIAAKDTFVDGNPQNMTIRWSNGISKESMAWMMLSCLKVIRENNIAIEYYAYDGSTLYACMQMVPGFLEEFNKVSVIVLGYPDYTSYSSKYTIFGNGHNGIRDWYCASLYFDSPLDVTDQNVADAFVPTAAMSTEKVLSLTGKAYKIVKGQKTVPADDDEFKRFSYSEN